MRNKNTQSTGRGWLCVYTYEIVRTDVREPGRSNQGLSFIILIVSIAPIQADRAAGSNLPPCHRVTAKEIYLPLRFLLTTHAPPVRDSRAMPAYRAIPISPVSGLFVVVSVGWDGVVELLGLT